MTTEIEVYKNKLQDIKIKKGVKEERKEEVMEELSEDYGIKTLAQANKRLKQLSPKIDKLEKQEKKLIEEIGERLYNYESD